MADSTHNFILRMIADLSGANQTVQAQAKIKQALESTGRAFDAQAKVVKTTYTDGTVRIGNFNKEAVVMNSVIQNTNGTITSLSAAFTKHGQKLNLVHDSVQSTTTAVGALNNGTTGLGATFAKTISRAALTIPIWFALRAILSSLGGVISLTKKQMEDLDEATVRSLIVVGGIAQVGKTAEEVRSKIKNLATTFGTSIEDIGKGLAEFTGANFEVKDSLAGIEVATKLAKAGFAELKPTVSVLTDIMLNFKDDLKGFGDFDDQIKTLATGIEGIIKPNKLTLDDFTASLKNAIPAAIAAKVKIGDLLAVIATLSQKGLKGADAGTAFSTALKFVQDPSKLAKVQEILNVPISDKPFQNLLLVLSNLEKLSKDGAIGGTINEIFGKKGSQSISLLASSMDVLNRNQKLYNDLTSSGSSGFKQVEKDAAIAAKTIKSLEEKQKQLLASTGGAFFQGITGAKDYQHALISLNNFIEKTLTPTMRGFGSVVRATFEAAVAQSPITWAANLGKFLGKSTSGVNLSESNKSVVEAGLRLEMAKIAHSNSVNQRNIEQSVTGGFKQPGFTLGTIDITPEELQRARELQAERTAILNKGLSGDAVVEKQVEINALVDEQLSKYRENAGVIAGTLPNLSKQQILLALQTNSLDTIVKLTGNQVINQAFANRLTEKQNQLLDAQRQKVKAISDELKNTFAGSLEDLFSNKITGRDFVGSVGNSFRQQTIHSGVKGITERLASSGVFGNFSQALVGLESNLTGNPIVDSFSRGGDIAADKLFRALSTAPVGGSAVGGTLSSLGSPLASVGGAFGGVLSGIGGLFGGGSGRPAGVSGPLLANGQFGSGGNQNLKNAFNVIGPALLTGFASSQSGGAAGGILGGLGAGLTGLGGLTNLAGAALLGPAAPFALAAGFALSVASMFAGGQKKVTEEYKQQSIQIASKIDVSNKILTVLNRNLLALHNVMETYILRDSAYFSSARNLSDQFSIQARQGLA